MSTRSNIAIELPKDKKGNKKVKVIYVHSDGYPYGVGKCLVDHYNNYDLAKNYFNMETPAIWEIPSMSVVSTVATGTGKKIQPEPSEMNGCICMICAVVI